MENILIESTSKVSIRFRFGEGMLLRACDQSSQQPQRLIEATERIGIGSMTRVTHRLQSWGGKATRSMMIDLVSRVSTGFRTGNDDNYSILVDLVPRVFDFQSWEGE
ncbi:hypothetical protein SK128_023191, partial [Halocaridina rubra]